MVSPRCFHRFANNWCEAYEPVVGSRFFAFVVVVYGYYAGILPYKRICLIISDLLKRIVRPSAIPSDNSFSYSGAFHRVPMLYVSGASIFNVWTDFIFRENDGLIISSLLSLFIQMLGKIVAFNRLNEIVSFRIFTWVLVWLPDDCRIVECEVVCSIVWAIFMSSRNLSFYKVCLDTDQIELHCQIHFIKFKGFVYIH